MLSIVDTLQNLLNDISIFTENVFSIFPSEINVILITAFGIILALYIYRLLR